MKKVLSFVLAALMVAALVPALVPVSTAADGGPQAYVAKKFNHIVQISYDEVRYGLKPNGSDERPYVYCGGDAAKTDTPHLPENTQSAIFWGWVSADGSDIQSFSYVQEGKYTLSLPKFKEDPGSAVLAAAKGEFTYRFHVIVPVDPAGIRTVQVFANFADGTSEEIWRARVYIPPYDESTFVDPLPPDAQPGDVNSDGSVDNKDVIALFRYVSGDQSQVSAVSSADVNEDGAVDNKDVVMLFRYVSGGGELGATWTSVDMYDSTMYNSKEAKQLKTGGYLAERFSVNASFNSISVWCPSWGNNTGDLRLSLYKYSNDLAYSLTQPAAATRNFKNYNDNAWLTLEFPAQAAGEYIAVLSDPTETVGAWVYPSSVSRGLLYDGGFEIAGELSMKISVSSVPSPLFNKIESETSSLIPPEPEDSPAIRERDAMPDTWAAVDGLGRVLPGNAETGDPKKDKYVGLFYWTWHVEHAKNYSPINLQQICDKYPDAVTNHDHSVWSTIGSYYGCFWNEPVFGYYTTTDKWVLRKHAELLADAGVDVIIFDNTNGTFTWRESYTVLLEVFKKAREDGVKTPKISFILPFGDGNAAATQLREIYQTVYKNKAYNELWFYWDEKPLIMSLTSGLDTSKALDAEIAYFFTFRRGVPQYNDTPKTNTDLWGWLARYPQATYTDKNGMKQISVGVAQNWSASAGLTAMNGTGIFGRTYTSKGYDQRENAKLYGANFAEQWEYAIKKNVNFVFVTGWNEWIAQKQPTWQGVKNAFPDEFNDEYSRDIEPSTGELKDHYYYQLVSYIRKFKGVRAVPEPSAEKTIYVSGATSQWNDVGPYYVAYKGNTFARDSAGYKGTTYKNTTGRNDITGAKVARDASNLYFMVECADDITPYTDKAWMRLFIDTGDSDKSWEGFEYVVNRVSPTSAQVTLERSKGGWSFETVGQVAYKVTGSTLVIKIPKSYLGITSDKFTVNFKWNDNMQKDGDIMDFYSNGDTAPGGRFMYTYSVK